ncbi:hypothetical protein INT45_011231 [Circinella minor]|uniref:Myb/SANT-like DNA-binding domain-containing protein n=1 Tax=Circinella minor TaxID=1195481 RepID=A0A8H7VNA8_9FUNG|nr:hypothetical protein INT45_011231 [Circinella minor]
MHQKNTVSSSSTADNQLLSKAGGKAALPNRSVLRHQNDIRRPDRLHRRVTFNVSADQEVNKTPMRHFWRDAEIKKVLEFLKQDFPGTWDVSNEKEKEHMSHVIACELFDNGYRVNPKTVKNKITVVWKRYNECLNNDAKDYKFFSQCHDAFTRSVSR